MHEDLLLLQSGKSLARLRAVEQTLARVKRWSLAIGALTAVITAGGEEYCAKAPALRNPEATLPYFLFSHRTPSSGVGLL